MTLYGLERQTTILHEAIASGRMHHAWLLNGPAGVGKGTLARQTAARLLAMASATGLADPGVDLPDDHPTARLIAAQSHPDLVILERLTNDKQVLARSIVVDQVRALRNSLALGAAMSDRRVIVVDAVDDLERGGANALLKTLEEPPTGTIFLLISHAPGRLLPTIRSRCRVLTFAPLDDADVAAALRARLPDMSEAASAAVAAAGRGSVGSALRLATLDIDAIDEALTKIAKTGDPANVATVGLAQMLSGKAATASYHAFLAHVPGFVARSARMASGRTASSAADVWTATSRLATGAVAQSLPPDAVVIELCRHVAMLHEV